MGPISLWTPQACTKAITNPQNPLKAKGYWLPTSHVQWQSRVRVLRLHLLLTTWNATSEAVYLSVWLDLRKNFIASQVYPRRSADIHRPILGLPGKPGIPSLRRAILGLRKFPVCANSRFARNINTALTAFRFFAKPVKVRFIVSLVPRPYANPRNSVLSGQVSCVSSLQVAHSQVGIIIFQKGSSHISTCIV